MKIKNIFHSRTIQVHLLTLFILLMGFSCFSITNYTYNQYLKDINNLATATMDQVNTLLLEKVKSLQDEAVLVTEIIKGSIQTKEKITGQDPDYIHFLLNLLRNDPFFTAIMIASPSGDYFSVVNLNLLEDSLHFYFDPSEKLPKEAYFAIRIVHQKKDLSEETWTYLNEKGEILTSESMKPASSDFRENPWMLDMIKDPHLKWASEALPRGSMKYRTQKSYSVTVSDVVKTPQGDLFAICSVALAFRKLSSFFEEQKIGQTGAAFILDGTGNMIIPLSYGRSPSEAHTKKLVEEGYREFKTRKEKNFTFKKDGEKYLFSIRESLALHEKDSVLAILVPFNDFFGETTKVQNKTLFMSFLILLISWIAAYFAVKYISRPIMRIAKDVDKIREFDFTKRPYVPSEIIEIADLEHSVDAMRAALHSFGRYVPKEIVKNLIREGHDVDLGGEKVEITIMFSDIENFTTLSEALTIEDLMPLLSDYFDVLSKIILESDGTIDKYIGDSVMSFWGAPLKTQNHAEKACLAALRSLKTIKDQKKWTTRFGIHTGNVVVGNIGTSERINYTVIGDAVNVASRLEEVNKEYKTSIIISEIVHEKIGPFFITRPIDFVAVKGKKTKLRIFELMGTKEGDLSATQDQIELSTLFTIAYNLFEEGLFKEALESFRAIEKKFPSDGPTKKYLERCLFIT